MQLGGKIVEDVFVFIIILHFPMFTVSTYYFYNQEKVNKK